MTAGAPAPIDVERALGSAVLDLLGTLRGEARPEDDGDALAGRLAGHALVGSVTGCAVCLIDGDERVRVAGVAGMTGGIAAGSLWPLAESPVSQALAGASRLAPLDPAGTAIGRSLGVGSDGELLAMPLRVGGDSRSEPTSTGALVLVREGSPPLTEQQVAFLEAHAALVALSMLRAAPAQDFAARARRLHRSVDAAVDAVGSLDARTILSSVLRRACEGVQADRATLMRIDGDDVVVEGVHDTQGRASLPDWRGPVRNQPLLMEAMRTGTMVVGGAIPAERRPPALDEALEDIRHSLVVPVSLGSSAEGFLLVFRRQRRPFVQEDAATLQLLGNVALLALRNSRLYADSRAASEAMASFLSLIAHDLRAPLTVLGGYVDLLRDGTFGEGPPAWQKPLVTITAKLHETQRLVDDIMLAARLDSGVIPCTPEALDLGDVVSRAAARCEARASLAGARVETVLPAVPVFAVADGFHVDRIVDNLVNNAINYGGPAPWIRISVDPSEPPAIRVEDHGVGISPELHSRIFDRFFRVENQVPGTGFGLHVGRVLAEACNGSLRVERSTPGEGSVFRLQLPPMAAPPTTG